MQALAELKALNASPMKDELRGVSDFEIEPSPVHATLDRFQSEQRQAATGSGADAHSHVRQLRFSSDAAVMDAAVSSASNQGRNRVLKANGLQGVDIYDIHNLEPDDERPWLSPLPDLRISNIALYCCSASHFSVAAATS